MNDKRERGLLSEHKYHLGDTPKVADEFSDHPFIYCDRAIGIGDKLIFEVGMHRGAPGYERIDNYPALLDTTQHIIDCWNAFEEAGIDPADAMITKREE